MWTKIIFFINDINPLINLAIAGLWGIYVYYTIKTFKEIHRQTELQSEAFLIVSCNLIDSTTEKTIIKNNDQNMATYDKWHEILRSHIPTAIGQKKYLALIFNNKGRSDIVAWRTSVNASISPGQYLTKKFNIIGETATWNFVNEDGRDIIPAGESVTFIIAQVGVYPQIKCSWKIEYSDMRDKKYNSFTGDRDKLILNSLAYSKDDVD